MNSIFQKTTLDFFKNLKKTFPEKKKVLEKLQKDYGSNPFEVVKIENFLEVVKPHYVSISKQDQDIFFSNNVIEIFPNLNLSELWTLGISERSKNSIWSYLQLLILLGFSVISKSDSISNVVKQMKTLLKNDKSSETTKVQATSIIQMVKNIKQNKNFSESVKPLFPDLTETSELSDDDDNDDSSEKTDKALTTTSEENQSDDKEEDDFDPTQFFSGTKIGELAKEIAEEIDIDNLGLPNIDKEPSNVQDAFQQILGNNPSALMNTVQKIGSKVQEKIGNSGMSQQDMVNEAQDMVKNLHQNPMFKDVLGNNDMGGMFQQMSSMMQQMQKSGAMPNMANMANMAKQQQQQSPYQNTPTSSRNNTPNSTRERLQAKLKKKREQQQKNL